jgi:GNAT superfamily N-acetyltransferase
MIRIVERNPTEAEYARLITSVGWKGRDRPAIAAGLAGSLFAVCAEDGERTVGFGRIIGDGGLHYYLSDIVVHPDRQRSGIGTMIVRALVAWLEQIPHQNTFVGLFAVEGTVDFYARFGFRAQGPTGPAMFQWRNCPSRVPRP